MPNANIHVIEQTTYTCHLLTTEDALPLVYDNWTDRELLGSSDMDWRWGGHIIVGSKQVWWVVRITSRLDRIAAASCAEYQRDRIASSMRPCFIAVEAVS
jgi:hypothetical protein